MLLNRLVIQLLSNSLLDKEKLSQYKRQWAKKAGKMPRTTDILTAYHGLLNSKQIKRNINLEKLLRLKSIRSLSGIVPIAVLTKSYPCPGKCIYCPTQKNMPKSYLNDEPAVMRAIKLNFDPYLQVQNRLEQLQITGHETQKVELIVMGGTFSCLPKNYQIWFITNCFAAANERQPSQQSAISNQQLAIEQRFNETAKHRIVGLTLETRPDQINEKEIKFMRQLGCTRVEIGVQSIYNQVLKKVNRGHTVEATIKATRLLKDAGFKVCYHIMPNLPGSSLKMDLMMFKQIFNNSDFCPDMIKIYPCVVLSQAKLINWWKQGKYKPYSDNDLINLLIIIKKIVPPWIRINRLGRDIPIANIVAGNKISNIRQIIQQKLKDKNIKCQCIRCREVREKKFLVTSYQLQVINYPASSGKEYFLQYVDKDNNLYALSRLRITSDHRAIIRELHTYGEALAVNDKNSKASQHQGLGKLLISEAEKITKSLNISRILVIAGVGVRGYYRKLGYKLENTYMVKWFPPVGGWLNG